MDRTVRQLIVDLTINVLCCVVLSNGRQPSEGSLPGWPRDRAAVPVGAVSEVNSVTTSSKGLTRNVLVSGAMYFSLLA